MLCSLSVCLNGKRCGVLLPLRLRDAGRYVTQDIEEEYLSILEQSTRTKDRVLAGLNNTDSTEALSNALPR